MRLILLPLLLLVLGCDAGTSPDTATVAEVSVLDIAAIQRVREDGAESFHETDALRGIFRFAIGASVTIVSTGDCQATTSGECFPRLVLRALPATAELVLDADVVADGGTVAAGDDLSPLLADPFREHVTGFELRRNLDRQVYGAWAPLRPEDNLFFDPARVRVPDGERTLTLRWTMPDAEVIEASATFDYSL